MSDPSIASVAVPVTTVWTSPDAVRDVDAPMISGAPDVAAWLAALGVSERLDLLGRVETQALLGEPLLIVDETDGWFEVRLPWQRTRRDATGYPGWIRAEHVAIDAEPVTAGGVLLNGDCVVVTERLAPTRVHPNAPIAFALSMGTVLRTGDRTDELVELRTPRGSCWLRADAAAPLLSFQVETTTTPGGLALIERASTMLGLPYLWSGISGWGVDCSGLVYLANRSLGRLVSRDSADQRLEHQAAGQVAVGEQLFFRYNDERDRIHHVGLALDADTMLHAPKTGRVVEMLALSTEPYRSELERAVQ